MSRRASLILAAAVALVAVVAIGVLQSSPSSRGADGGAPTAAQLRERLAGSPAPLARLHDRPNALLPARTTTAELAALKGYPVVVNKWASWCGPCRSEFPTFQAVSAQLGKRVAFLGLNSGDAGGGAPETFLRGYPLSYPSISDPDNRVAQKLQVAQSWPTTLFFDRAGKQTFAHQGPYLTAADLTRDIRRYAGT
jgi:cytochrome c biogenesis protein CcmG, thiol:disulfide interchange protein DsbE